MGLGRCPRASSEGANAVNFPTERRDDEEQKEEQEAEEDEEEV